jgi:hypothetical protein
VEARASFSGPSVSRTFVAAVLVIVAMGLVAMAGYAAGAVFGSSTPVTTSHAAVAAPVTSLRQDNDYPRLTAAPGLRQDNDYPRLTAAPGTSQERSTGHKELP